MTLSLADFRLEYPEFASVPDATVQRQLDLFPVLYANDYGVQTDYLMGLFAAHQVYVKTEGKGGPVQAVVGSSVGDVSTQYAQSSAAAKAADFASSKYGLEFYRLMSYFGMGPMITGNTIVYIQ